MVTIARLVRGLKFVAAALLLAAFSAEHPVRLFSTAAAATSPVATLRVGESMTRLSDGQLLISGAVDSDGRPTGELFIADRTLERRSALRAGLTERRTGHTATVLPDGRVLFLGGLGQSGLPVLSAEILDSDADSVTTLGSIGLRPRALHTATVLSDGSVLIAGGVDGGRDAVLAAELFDGFALRPLSFAARMHAARHLHLAQLAPDGSVIFYGGLPATTLEASYAELFDSTELEFNGIPASRAAQALAFLSTSAAPSAVAWDLIPPAQAAATGGGSASVFVVRFNKPVTLPGAVDAITIELAGNPVPSRAVLAEAGMLAFVHVAATIDPRATVTIRLNRLLDAAGKTIPPQLLTIGGAGSAPGGPPPGRPAARVVPPFESAASPATPAPQVNLSRGITRLDDKQAIGLVQSGSQRTIPLFFEINSGHDVADVKARALGPGYGVFLTERDVVLKVRRSDVGEQLRAFRRSAADEGVRAAAASSSSKKDVGAIGPDLGLAQSEEILLARAQGVTIKETDVLRIRPLGGASRPVLVPEQRLKSVTHYVGRDGKKTGNSAPHYSRVRFKDVYPGIDKVNYGAGGRLEYDWIVKPGADPRVIAQELNGASSVELLPSGDLRVVLDASTVTIKRPVAYQEIGSVRRPVEVAFDLSAGNTVQFKIGAYDRTKVLVIDPIVEYTTYLGDATYSELYLDGMRVARDGSVYFILDGNLSYLGTQTAAEPRPSFFPSNDSVVMKLNAAGNVVEFITVLKGLVFRSRHTDVGPIDHSLYFVATEIDGTLPFPQGGTPTFTTSPMLGRLSNDGATFAMLRRFSEYQRVAPGSGFGIRAEALRVAANGDYYVAFNVYSAQYNSIITSVTTLVGTPTQWTDFFQGCALHRLSSQAVTQYTAVFDRCLLRGIAVDPSGRAYIADSFKPNDWRNQPLEGLFSNGRYIYPAPGASPTSPGGTVVAPRRLYRINGDGSIGYSKPITARPTLQSTGIYHMEGGPSLSGSGGVAVDTDNNVFVIGNALSKFDGNGELVASLEPVRPNQNDAVVRGLPWPLDPEVFYDYWIGGGLRLDPDGQPIVAGELLRVRTIGFQNILSSLGHAAKYGQQLSVQVWDREISTDLTPTNLLATRLVDIGRDQYGGLYFLGFTTGTDLALRNPIPGTQPTGPSAFLTKWNENLRFDSTPNPSLAGQPVELRIQVEEENWPGTFTFRNGTTALGSAPVVSRVSAITVPSLAVGTYTFIAEYSGDTTRLPGATYTVSHSVKQSNDATSTALAIATPTVIPGPYPLHVLTDSDPVVLTAGVTGTNLTGEVAFIRNAVEVGRAPVGANGVVTFDWGTQAVGAYTMYARYLGDPLNAPSTSAPVRLEVRETPIVITFTSPVANATFPIFSTVNVAVNVSGPPIARVRLNVNGTVVGDAIAAPYTFVFRPLVPGTYTMFAEAFTTTGRRQSSFGLPITVTEAAGSGTTLDVTFIHHDAAGSAISATNGLGGVLWTRGYEPFGEFASVSGATADAAGNYTGTRQFYHGKPLDTESGLQYFGARYYDPQLGRFTGIDPAPWNEGNLHSFNRYAFANNNPMRFTDPDGYAPTPIDGLFILIDAGKVIGAIYTGVGIPAALADLGLSVAGVLVPVPGGGLVLKGLRGAENAAEAAVKGTLVVRQATKADGFQGVYKFAESGGHYVGETGRGVERLAEHIAKGRPDPNQVIKIQEVAGGQLQRQVVETQTIAKTGADLRNVAASAQVTNKKVPISEKRALREGIEPKSLGFE